MGHTSLLYPPAPSCGTISFGTAIKAAVRHGYMGNPSTVVLWEQDTTYCTPCLCLLCGRGSRPWMWEPRRQIHPAPSTTISDIPHQSHHIRWPCLLFCVSLSHTVWHRSCSTWYLQLRPDMGLVWLLNTWVSPKTTADHAWVQSTQTRRDVGLKGSAIMCHLLSANIFSCKVSLDMFVTISLSSCSHCLTELFFQYLCLIFALKR